MAHAEHSGEHHHGVGHIVPVRITLAVGMALLVLTVVTVLTAKFVDLGPGNIWLALAIAFTKASLVCLYFMHLRWDSPFNTLVLITSFFGVLLFIGFALTDTSEYQGEIKTFQTSEFATPPPAPPAQ
ncbi:MAG: cytochrome C oxidase subunit IV family protein [Phycisphaeraceae bacterium]|nr:cytochrome C oxidase subunit IV family protein [Phycisphaerales bacterium]QOJ17929.1 MAG: cytochrome C oxidase subunit IV family protein [Phycisphaeraceae bacterium]